MPASLAHWPVSLRVYTDRLLFVAEGQMIMERARHIVRDHDRPGQTIYRWRHYLAVAQRRAM